jgi:ribosomal protein L22
MAASVAQLSRNISQTAASAAQMLIGQTAASAAQILLNVVRRQQVQPSTTRPDGVSPVPNYSALDGDAAGVLQVRPKRSR